MKRNAGLLLIALVCLPMPVRAQGRDALIIALLPEVTVDQTIIALEQVARISGGSLELRRQVGKLDVAELRLYSERTSITRDQVRFRLLLAGLDSGQFYLVGAIRTVVREPDEPITLRKLLAAAEGAVRKTYPGDATRVTMSEVKGTIVPLVKVQPGDRVQFEAKPLAPTPRAGKARTEVTILINGVARAAAPVAIDIRVPEPAVLPIEYKTAPPRPARPTINQPAKVEPKKTLIKSGDRVKIVAPVGGARIEAIGEAMSDGALGEVIRVRNIESNRVVHGRIEVGGTVVVEY